MTIKEPYYYKQVPLSAEAEAKLRLDKAKDTDDTSDLMGELKRTSRRMDHCTEGRIETSDVQKLGNQTLIGKLLWVYEDREWNCWKRFGQEGWLLVETRPEKVVKRISRADLSRRNTFTSSRDLFAYEERLRKQGLKLTAKYRRDYERRVAEAERKLAKGKPKAKPNNTPPRPKM